jgi:hypothetical protein
MGRIKDIAGNHWVGASTGNLFHIKIATRRVNPVKTMLPALGAKVCFPGFT